MSYGGSSGSYTVHMTSPSYSGAASQRYNAHTSLLLNASPDYGSGPVSFSGMYHAKKIAGSTVGNDDSPACRTMHEFSPDPWLQAVRPTMQFVGDVQKIECFIRDAYRAVTGFEFPDNIVVRVCSYSELKGIHKSLSSGWSEGVQGFSLNGPIAEVFVKQDRFDRVMITMGHEIGHVLSATLSNKTMEEAKAFAFEMAWVKVLRENDIGGLKECIIDMVPAANGLHDKAFAYVRNKIMEGMNALDVFRNLTQSSNTN